MVEDQHFARLQDKSVSDPRPLAERDWGGDRAYGIEVNNTGVPITDEPTEAEVVQAHIAEVKKREAEAAVAFEAAATEAVGAEAVGAGAVDAMEAAITKEPAAKQQEEVKGDAAGKTEALTSVEEESAGISVSKLAEPTSDVNRCTENAEDLNAFAVFSPDQRENAELYNTVAAKYDGMQEMSGFNDPYELAKTAVEKLGQEGQPLANADARLLDFGCGTGLMGLELKKVGYTNVYGIDGSAEMLAIADTKGIYKWTWEVLVGLTPLPLGAYYREDLAGSGYDAVFSSACMIKGHFPNSCFEEMLKALRPGGHMIFTIRDIYLNPETDNDMNFVGKMAELVEAGKMIHVDTVHFQKYKGLQFGSGYQEEGANVKIFQKPAAPASTD